MDASTTYTPSPLTDPTATAPLTSEVKERILAKAEELASQGLRVISIGQKRIDSAIARETSREDSEREHTFLGLVGIFDPPRPETLGAVRACKAAGIVVHMCV